MAALRKEDLPNIEAILDAAGVTASVIGIEKLRWYAEYFVGKALSVGNLVFDEHYAQYMAALSGKASPVAIEAARRLAEDSARKRAGTMVTQMLETEIKALGNVVADGLEMGWGPRQVARYLDMVQDLDSGRAATLRNYIGGLEKQGLSESQIDAAADKMKQSLLQDRRETIARTEMHYATSQARRNEADERGARYKVNITTGEKNVCDNCLMNEIAGAIPINESFPSGHDMDPFHPSCRCSVTYFTDDKLATAAGKRAEERGLANAEIIAAAEGKSTEEIIERAKHTAETTKARNAGE